MKAIEISDVNFVQEVERSTVPVLVDFFANWCGPCRQQLPIVEELATELGDSARITKINVDENQQKAREYGVSGIPALLVFKDGKLVKQVSGLHSKSQLKELIAPFM